MPPKASKGEYIETDTGNKISRKSHIHGTPHIILGGKTVIQADVCIRGDLVRQQSSSTSSSTDPSQPQQAQAQSQPAISISIGRYTYLSRSSTLRPPSRLHRGIHTYIPLKIGESVFIGERAVIEAASIGSHVHIGDDAVIGSMAILRDYVKVLDGTVVPPGMVVPSWCVVGGVPGRVVGELGEGWGVEGVGEGGESRERYKNVR